MSEVLNEAIQYFKAKKGYTALFHLFRKKYESLGRTSGAVKLNGFSNDEVEALAQFMAMSPHHLTRKGTLSLVDFENQLGRNRFSGISLLDLLEGYFGEKIQSKKSVKEELAVRQLQILNKLRSSYPAISEWFTYLERRSPDTKWIWRLMLDPAFEKDVKIVHTAYVLLPTKVERYPLFSQRVTGDPHSLDLSTVRGKLWLHLLHILSGGEGPAPVHTEAINDLLLSYQLLRDDISNFVTAANLVAVTPSGPHPVWKAALESGTVLNIPLRELLKIEEVYAEDNKKNVYIVENSGVFSALLDEVPEVPLICTHGQFKLAGLKLMDMLAKAGHKLHYSGDFDPEGLSMAKRFKERYGEQGFLWRMTVSDYTASHPNVDLGIDRRRKLIPLFASELSSVAIAMNEEEKIGYQEGIIKQLITDLQSSI